MREVEVGVDALWVGDEGGGVGVGGNGAPPMATCGSEHRRELVGNGGERKNFMTARGAAGGLA